MQVFFAPDINCDLYSLDGRESKHVIRVLRMKKGDPVYLIDGKGNLFEGMISDPDPEGCIIKIKSFTPDFEMRAYRLHVAISPLKNTERFEWFTEKAVEIGVDEITPVICRNTEKPGIKPERIRSIIISAMKQSLKAKETILNPVVSFSEFINNDHAGKLLIAHCHEGMKRLSIRDVCSPGDDAVIMIGPEGDFTINEVEEASDNKYSQVHLGRSRLRTETAGIAACHSLYFLNQ